MFAYIVLRTNNDGCIVVFLQGNFTIVDFAASILPTSGFMMGDYSLSDFSTFSLVGNIWVFHGTVFWTCIICIGLSLLWLNV